jgi:hypothetical protein
MTRSTAPSNGSMRVRSIALSGALSFALLAASACSSSGEPTSGGDGGDATSGDAAHDVAFDIDTTPPDNGCPLAFDPAKIDCTRACANYQAWCETTPCKTPYCDKPSDCLVVCDATKSVSGFTNALFGCAALHSACEVYQSCLAATCPTP